MTPRAYYNEWDIARRRIAATPEPLFVPEHDHATQQLGLYGEACKETDKE